tara:strand:+ start:1876 stop:2505 length:630 start_codon:yes stop_codon:yes gene_type:complete
MNTKAKPVIILGAGGHAGVLIETLNKLEINILGLTVASDNPIKQFQGIKILGDDSQVSKYSPDEVLLVNGIGSLPGDNTRHNISSSMRDRGYEFLTLIDPDSLISEKVFLSEGCQIMTGSIIQYETSIGKDTIINTGSVIDHQCTIGASCHIATGSVLSGNVSIGDNTHIGTGTKIINNIEIGENVVVAAGSVVYRDISSGTKFIQKKS